MTRHAAPRKPARALLRAGLTISAAGVALAGAGGAAQAAPSAAEAAAQTDRAERATPPAGPTQVVTGALGHALAPVRNLQINPLAKTGADPLDNAVGTQVGDFKPLSTALVTGPLAGGASLSDLLP